MATLAERTTESLQRVVTSSVALVLASQLFRGPGAAQRERVGGEYSATREADPSMLDREVC